MYLKVAEWIHVETSKSAKIGRQCKTKSYKFSFNNTSLLFFPSGVDLVSRPSGLGSVLVSV